MLWRSLTACIQQRPHWLARLAFVAILGSGKGQPNQVLMEGERSMSTENEVRNASKQFYTSLNRMANGDACAMADIWKHSPSVMAMHPIGGREVGWDAVRASFEKVAQLASDGKIELKEQLIRVVGDVAFEAGIEHGQIKLGGQQATIEHRVTNIYQREAGAWKVIHHHTDTSPAMLDVLSRLRTPSGTVGR